MNTPAFLSGITATFLVGLSLTCFTPAELFAQHAPAKQWDKRYGGNQGDILYDIRQTSDGGYVLGGNSASGLGGDKSQPGLGTWIEDYWIVKLDASGNKVWDKTFGGQDQDKFRALCQTSDGGYLLGGPSLSGSNGDKSQVAKGGFDFWVVKTDAAGNKLWDKSFGGNLGDVLTALQQTADGGYILGGYSASPVGNDKTQPSRGLNDFWIIKLDAGGNKLWDKTFGGNDADALYSLQQTSDGGYVLGGSSKSGIGGEKSQPSRGSEDFWIVKTDASGNKLWDKTYGGIDSEGIYTLKQTSDGGYILGGTTSSLLSGDKSQPSQGLDDFWVVKLDGNGNKLWDKTYGGNDEDWLYSVEQTPDGGYIFGGESRSGLSGDKSEPNLGNVDWWVVKADANGNKIWDKSWGGNDADVGGAIRLTSDGGYVYGGASNSMISGDVTQAPRGGLDYWVIKLAPEILGVKDPEANSGLSVFPNPSYGNFNLQLSSLTAATADITVSDLLGRVVLQKQIPVNNNRISEELTLPNAKGLYLLQVKAGETLATRKIVVE